MLLRKGREEEGREGEAWKGGRSREGREKHGREGEAWKGGRSREAGREGRQWHSGAP